MTQNLITRLSKLDAPDREVDALIVKHFGLENECPYWLHRFTRSTPMHLTASVDAAIALAERVLPGWVFDNVGQDFHSVPGGYAAFGWNVELINGTRVQGQAPTLPLAICIAILRAKEASNAQ